VALSNHPDRRSVAGLGATDEWGAPQLPHKSLARQLSVFPPRHSIAGLPRFMPASPAMAGVSAMPWWAPLGGLVGAFAVIAGLLFVNKVGAGAFAGLTITANILMSLVIDRFGWFGMDVHPLNGWRMLGAVLMVSGIALIAKF
jgi:bacterial/archaeal transporter family-2 protein